MRRKWILGNWKMYTNTASARALATAVVEGVGTEKRVGVGVCPPFPYLSLIGEVIKGSPIQLLAQNCYFEKEGAFTGEVSPNMLADVGCAAVLVGHSERRHILGESDATVNRKVHAALKAGLIVVLCIGETLDERKANRTEGILSSQLDAGLSGVDKTALDKIIVAYEPVWAIGTGVNAAPDQAQQAHSFLRRRISDSHGEETAAKLPIVYGGSVKAENAAALLGEADIDGCLIGGASLKADQFLSIFQAAVALV